MIRIKMPGEELEIYMRLGPKPIKPPSSSPNQMHPSGSIKDASMIGHVPLLSVRINRDRYTIASANESIRFQVIIMPLHQRAGATRVFCASDSTGWIMVSGFALISLCF